MKNIEMHYECVRRMQLLDMHPLAIKEFQQDNRLNLSHNGLLFWLNDGQKRIVKEFEQETGLQVYHVVEDYTKSGHLLSLLFVSPDCEEWMQDRAAISGGRAFAYVINVDDPQNSEYGTIGVRPFIGGVLRTA